VFDSCVQVQPTSNITLHAPVPDGPMASNPTQPPYVSTELLPPQHAVGETAPASVSVPGHDADRPSMTSMTGAGPGVSSSSIAPSIGADRTCDLSATAAPAASTSDHVPT
jgi:hypothetical protein